MDVDNLHMFVNSHIRRALIKLYWINNEQSHENISIRVISMSLSVRVRVQTDTNDQCSRLEIVSFEFFAINELITSRTSS
jgi:hypothetical protein